MTSHTSLEKTDASGYGCRRKSRMRRVRRRSCRPSRSYRRRRTSCRRSPRRRSRCRRAPRRQSRCRRSPRRQSRCRRSPRRRSSRRRSSRRRSSPCKECCPCGCGCPICRCGMCKNNATLSNTSPDCYTCSNAFMNFLSEYRRKSGNNRHIVNVAEEAGRLWQDMSDEEKEEFNYKSPSDDLPEYRPETNEANQVEQDNDQNIVQTTPSQNLL